MAEYRNEYPNEYTTTETPTQVPNYLVQAILVTIFCCQPFGIVSIVFAAQVNGKLEAGDTQGAISSSDNAKKWCWIGFITGLVGILAYILLIVAGAASGSIR